MEAETWLSDLLDKSSRSSSEDCIFYGVPEDLKKKKEKEFYTPQVVSIGPLHYGDRHLQPMRPKKEQYLKRFVARTGADKVYLYKLVKELEGMTRAYYQGNVEREQHPEKSVNILLLDGIFVIEFLLTMCLRKQVDQRGDEIFETVLLRDDIFHDMLILLENQLPFTVLKALYKSCQTDIPWGDFLYFIAKEWFKGGVIFDKAKEISERGNIRHLADYLHVLCVVSIPREKSKPNGRQIFVVSRRANELCEAGVKFSAPKDKLPFDLNFSTLDGTLEFPRLIVDRWTELSFQNLIAHEHCLHKEKIITSYIILLSSLLQTSKDVDLFIENKIIDNRSLGNSEELCNLFKTLYKRSKMDRSEFYYAGLCERLNEYSKDPWHQWKAACYRWKEMLKRDYFNSPWTIISVICAFILLILTIIQTVCSVVGTRWAN